MRFREKRKRSQLTEIISNNKTNIWLPRTTNHSYYTARWLTPEKAEILKNKRETQQQARAFPVGALPLWVGGRLPLWVGGAFPCEWGGGGPSPVGGGGGPSVEWSPLALNISVECWIFLLNIYLYLLLIWISFIWIFLLSVPHLLPNLGRGWASGLLGHWAENIEDR